VTTRPLPQPAIGTTVTLAVTTPVGRIGIVGVLVEADAFTWSIRRRDGTVSVVEVTSITAGRVVPPGRAARASVEEVERIAAMGWRAPQTQTLGDWLLRCAGGFTGRGNSALALGDPGVPLGTALDQVERWYADRGQPGRLQIPDGGTPESLPAMLDERSWTVSPRVHVMTAELGHVLRAVPARADVEVRVDTEPDEAWFAGYRQDGGTLPAAARELLTNHPAAAFASVRDGDDLLAIARTSVDDRWAGLFAVEVAPDQRGRGLGGLVSAAALRWAGQRGARRTYLQVSVANRPAVALYGRLGYTVHHDYLYREAPSVG
jgi:N-acetylglutamate synthase